MIHSARTAETWLARSIAGSRPLREEDLPQINGLIARRNRLRKKENLSAEEMAELWKIRLTLRDLGFETEGGKPDGAHDNAE